MLSPVQFTQLWRRLNDLEAAVRRVVFVSSIVYGIVTAVVVVLLLMILGVLRASC